MLKTEPDTGALKAGFEIREIGLVKSVREQIVRVVGLPSCMNGQKLEFANGAKGMVMGFTEDAVQVLAFGGKGAIRSGDEVYNRGQQLKTAVGEKFKGRVVSSLGEPTDGLGPIEPEGELIVFGKAPGVMERRPVDQTFETGTKLLDAVIPIAKGQRQLIVGDRMTGKSTLGVDAILNQRGHNVVCIYCCIGKSYASLVKTVRLLQAGDAMPYTIVVGAAASTSVAEQYLAPYTAATLGEHFMRKGGDVLVVFDDMTKHAWIYRQLSLLLERAPGREAYPGDIFYLHSQLVERAGYLNQEAGGGSMTFLPIVDILQGDVTGFIPSNLVSMTDGQIYLNTTLFNKGIKPAVDYGLSVSRIGSKAQWPAMKELSGKLRLEYLQYQELLQMTQLRSNLSADAAAKLKRGEAITELLVQGKNAPVAMEDQLLQLYALRLGLLDQLATSHIRKLKRELGLMARRWYPGLMPDIRKYKKLTPALRQTMEECLKRYMEHLTAETSEAEA